MSYQLKKELDGLAAQGITPNDLTPDELEALVDAVQRVRNPFTQVNMDALGEPLYNANGLMLYPLTIGAVVWLEEYAKRWWATRPKAYFWAVVYALKNGRRPGIFSELMDEATAFDAIKKEGLSLCVTETELSDAIDVALNFKRPPRKEKNTPEQGVDWAKVIVTLETQSGIPAEKWIWERSADYAVRAYNSLMAFAEAQAGHKPERMKDELDHAMNTLARVRSAILERVTRERAEKENAK